jgi:hypothetical protein
MAKIPTFETLDEAVAFWESHDSADYWEDMEEVQFELELHQNLLHPNLVILTHQPTHCPRCQHALDNVIIEYMTLDNGQFLVIRDVPAFQCQTHGHEYILEQTFHQVEQLLELEKKKKLQPTKTLKVPVFSLKMAY